MSREVALSDTIAGERARELGRLCVRKDDKRASLPLAGVRISARVADRVAEVSMVQTFRNPFAKALDALRKALDVARAAAEEDVVPSAEPIEKARKALLRELAGSPLGIKLEAVQRLLRGALLELVAALRARGTTPGSIRPLFDRCLKALEEAVGEPKFWEQSV